MNRDWNDFKSMHSNMAGAREAFENACETLFRDIYKTHSVSQVSVKLGDGGVDIFVGELGVEPITVIQCKFFLDRFSESQQSQIRKSFSSAINSDTYELKEWILCIPRVIDIDEHSWWFKWKTKQLSLYSKSKSFITIKNGNELIDLFKKQNLYNTIFQLSDSIKIEEIHNAVVVKENKLPVEIVPQNILFTNYTKKNELYYLERSVDKEFMRSLEFNNIWISGNSGFGKTTLITRDLIENKKAYCYCDLSPISILSSIDVLQEILLQIEERFILDHNPHEKNTIKNITEILSKVCHQEIIIVIDELSVRDISILRDIANDLINLVNYFKNNINGNCLKFVVSTISNPQDLIYDKSKATQYFHYIKCGDWSQDLIKLFHLLNSALNLKLENYEKNIIEACNFSPRVLKSIFRKIILLESTNSKNIEIAIKTTLSEL